MDSIPELSSGERQRYSRHLILPEVGVEGQRKLKGSSVLVIGAGGLGSPIILYLAAAGVGTIGIVDFDQIDVSNLQRQVLYSTSDVSKSKVETASRRARELNPEVTIVEHNAEVNRQNVMQLLQPYDVIADGSDNFATRYLVNDACILAKKPNVHGAIHRFEGQASVFAKDGAPCYRCIFPEPPTAGAVLNCAEAGVLGVLPGIIGTIQATECIKLLLSIGTTLAGRLLLIDALDMQFRTVNLKRDPKCTACGDQPSIKSITDSPSAEASCGSINNMTAVDLARYMTNQKDLVLLDVREQNEFEYSHLGQAMHIPLNRLSERIKELPENKEIVVYCRSGTRSRRAAEILQSAGIKNVRNLQGGIRAWQRDVEPSLSYYE